MTQSKESKLTKLLATSGKLEAGITLENYIRDWNLTPAELKLLTGHFLRNWDQQELEDKLVFDIDTGVVKVNLWRTDYIPVFQGDQVFWNRLCYLAVRGKSAIVAGEKMPKFWLSFRSGVVEGEKFNFVIIQEDKKL